MKCQQNKEQMEEKIKGKSKKKALLDLQFCVSCQFVQQICKESETALDF